jgi:hypothetical protein
MNLDEATGVSFTGGKTHCTWRGTMRRKVKMIKEVLDNI